MHISSTVEATAIVAVVVLFLFLSSLSLSSFPFSESSSPPQTKQQQQYHFISLPIGNAGGEQQISALHLIVTAEVVAAVAQSPGIVQPTDAS